MVECIYPYKQSVPLYDLYTFNCDTVASVIAYSVDENFKVYRYDGLDWLWGLMGVYIASPNLSFLYSKELNLEGWIYLNIFPGAKIYDDKNTSIRKGKVYV